MLRLYEAEPLSERILNSRIEEVAVLGRPCFPDKLAGEEVAVAPIAEQVTRKVVGGEEVDFRANVAGSGLVPPPEHGPSLAVERVAIGRAPEEVLLEGDGEVGDRSHGEAGTGTDDILPADVVDVPEE